MNTPCDQYTKFSIKQQILLQKLGIEHVIDAWDVLS